MSISRKNWKALSSLARQWTLEDEEEVERERRRRVRSSSSFADPDSPGAQSPSGDAPAHRGPLPPQTTCSAEPESEDFVDLLRSRDERRRLRRAESLRRQRGEEGGDGEREEGGDGATQGVRLAAATPAPPKLSRGAPSEGLRFTSPSPTSTSTGTARRTAGRQLGDAESPAEAPGENPASPSSHKFVSSVNISLDCASPTQRSPRTSSAFDPTPPGSPGLALGSPCHSPSPEGPPSPLQNGYSAQAAAAANSSPPPTTDPAGAPHLNRPPFARQSSRTTSFRLLKKKEGETQPLRRSSSVRLTSQKFEPHADPNHEDEKTSNFQRNTRQRVSSRSIQEKMERLAQAAQKPEVSRTPDVTQRTLVLMEEVSRKRDLFEKEHQASVPTSPTASRKEFNVSDGINRWLNRSAKPGSSPHAADLRHVDISSKKILFEGKQKE